jgi:hypothetical protein
MTGFVTREKLRAGATGGAGPAYLYDVYLKKYHICIYK